MTSMLYYLDAALAEIAGCFTFWAWLRLGKSPLWLVPGLASLVVFAGLLTRIESEFAGRAYAAVGGVYIAASLVWLWAIEQQRPDRWDTLGAVVCLTGEAWDIKGLPSIVRPAYSEHSQRNMYCYWAKLMGVDPT